MSDLKVWHWIAVPSFRPDPERPWVRQAYFIIAAPSKAAAARAVGESDPRRLFNLGETGNEQDCAAALASPGVLLWRPLDRYNVEPQPVQSESE